MGVAVWTASAADFECAARAGNTAKPIQAACSNFMNIAIEFMYTCIIFNKHTGSLHVFDNVLHYRISFKSIRHQHLQSSLPKWSQNQQCCCTSTDNANSKIRADTRT